MSWRSSLLKICLALAAASFAALSAHAALPTLPTASEADRLAAAQGAYDQAPDPVAKAKALAKLEPGVFAKARETLEDGNDVDTLAQLEHFRDETKTTVGSLETVGAHASDHPAGFKELQIALREAVRQMDGILLALPPDKHPWFRAVRSDLVDSQNELIDLLFPRQPHKGKTQPPS
jgi:hypothetical protein